MSYHDDEFSIDVEREGSLPTAEEVKNLQNFIDDEKNRDRKKSLLSHKQMYMLGGLLACLTIVIISMGVAISQNRKSARGSSREKDDDS